MKKLVVVVVLLAAVLLLAPFGLGKLAEKRVNRTLDKIVEQAPYLVITDRKWTGGWFKSKLDVTFELAPAFAQSLEDDDEKIGEIFNQESAEADAAMSAEGAEQAPAEAAADAAVEPGAAETEASTELPAELQAPKKVPPRFVVHNEILHGPLLGLSGFGLARVDSEIELPAEVVAKIREVFGPKDALDVSTRVGFFGGGTTTFTSEGRKLTPKDDDVIVEYDTFKLAVGFSKNADQYDIDGGWPTLTVRKAGVEKPEFIMSAMTIDGAMERVKGDLYDGDFAFRIGEISVPGKMVTVKDAHYVVDTRTKDGFVTVAAELGTGELKSPPMAMTGLEIKEIHYNFSLRHLHADTIEKMSREIRAAYAALPVSQDAKGFEQRYLAAIKDNGVELLKHDPELSIDRVGVVTPEGEAVAKGLIKFVGVTMEDFDMGGMGVIGKLDADITVEVSTKLLEKTPGGAGTIEQALASGYVKKDGDKLVCHIVFKKGELTLNGKPQAIPGLGGPPPGMSDESPEE